MFQKKKGTYQEHFAEMALHGVRYIPVVLSCYGRLHPKAERTLEQLAQHAGRRQGVTNYKALLQRTKTAVGVAVVTRAVAMARACFPKLTSEALQLLFGDGGADEDAGEGARPTGDGTEDTAATQEGRPARTARAATGPTRAAATAHTAADAGADEPAAATAKTDAAALTGGGGGDSTGAAAEARGGDAMRMAPSQYGTGHVAIGSHALRAMELVGYGSEGVVIQAAQQSGASVPD